MLNFIAFRPPKPANYTPDLPYLQMIGEADYQIPIRHYQRDPLLPTLLMSHANAEDVSRFDPKKLSEQFNANIVTYDYAGYGLHSCRQPSEQHCYKDVVKVYNYLKSIGVQNIVLYGRSIGTPVSCYLAYHLSKQNISVPLILVSAFKSLLEVMFPLPFIGYLPNNMFCIDCIAPQIKSPVLFIHGCNDAVTSIEQARDLSLKFPHLVKFVVLCGAGHHCVFNHQLYYNTIKEFLTQYA